MFFNKKEDKEIKLPSVPLNEVKLEPQEINVGEADILYHLKSGVTITTELKGGVSSSGHAVYIKSLIELYVLKKVSGQDSFIVETKDPERAYIINPQEIKFIEVLKRPRIVTALP